MPTRIRVAALIDLPRSPLSGGHVKGWENRARAAAKMDLPIDLTIYFSGPETTEVLTPHVRIRQLPPVFSTSRLKFLPYIPDHTDLAPYHPQLARELKNFDVIHTTDGFFNFAQTAEKIARKHGIPLVTSFHTDTPSYARVFTRRTIETLFGQNWLAHFLLNTLKLPEKQEQKMYAKLQRHLGACCHALAIREEDKKLAGNLIGQKNVHAIRLGLDLEMFGPHRKDRDGIENDYRIPKGRIIFLFVGRLDEGKNIYTLIEAMERLISEGLPVHLVTAGVGPAEEALRERLKGHVNVLGFVDPDELARLYASADGLALSSEVEIRSIAGIEAMASGLPALVSRKSDVAPAFSNTPAMRVVESGVTNWANALRDFANDSQMREHMAQTALAYGRGYIVDWGEALVKDFVPVWLKAFEESKK